MVQRKQIGDRPPGTGISKAVKAQATATKHISKFSWAMAALVALVVATTLFPGIAYSWFAQKEEVKNEMHLPLFSVVVEENFEIPDRWHMGVKVPKEVSFRNTGESPALFRVRYDEYWATVGNLDPEIRMPNPSTTFINPQTGGEEDTVLKEWTSLSFGNGALWADGGDGYYYYKKVLQPGQSVGPVLSELTINPNILKSSVAVDYLGSQRVYNLDFAVDAVYSSATLAAIQERFGPHVSVTVNSDGTVVWNFG